MINNVKYCIASQLDFTNIKNLMLTALKTDPFAFSSEYSEFLYNSDFWWNNYLQNYLNQNNALLYIAKLKGNVVAMGGVIFNQQPRRKHIASIVWIYSKVEFRGNGISKKIMEFLIKQIKDSNQILKVNLMVNASQNSAINMYSNFGFKTVATLKNEFFINEKYIDQHIMELYL